MTLDAISEERLQPLHPVLEAKVRAMAAALWAQGIAIRVVQGLRTVEEQDTLYASGRTAPGKIVTNVRGGYSYHNFGLAVDCVPSLNPPGAEYQPDWNPESTRYAAMVAAGVAQGLDAGADWETFKDHPHFQLTGAWPVEEPPDEARAAMQDGGLPAVWQAMQRGNDA
jgi:peptidoglycan LD-endopeptidase CwlK